MDSCKNFFAALMLLAPLGCASFAGDPATGATSDASERSIESGEMTLGALDEAELPKGECGMILWTLGVDRPAAIMRYVSGRDAEVVLDRNEMKFALDKVSGASGFGVYEELEFVSKTGKTLLVNFEFGLGFEGGTYLNRGIVTIESPDGWRSVTPAAGIAGCRKK